MRSLGKWTLVLVALTAGAFVAYPELLSELPFELHLPGREKAERPQLVQSGLGAPVAHPQLPPEEPMPAPTAVPTDEATVYGSCETKDLKEGLRKYSRAEAVLREVQLVSRGTESLVKLPAVGRKIDLIRLASAMSSLLTELTLPEGEYVEVRAVVEAASLTDGSGRVWPLEVPGGATEGIRISLSRVLEVRGDGNRPQISLTFCTDANFRLEGQERLSFHPAIERVYNLSI